MTDDTRRLVERLREYAQHKPECGLQRHAEANARGMELMAVITYPSCRSERVPNECTCGLEALSTPSPAPQHVEDALHAVFTRHGIASRSGLPYALIGDLIRWAADMCRQSRTPSPAPREASVQAHDHAKRLREMADQWRDARWPPTVAALEAGAAALETKPREAVRVLEAAARDLRQNANRLCDRNTGGTYEEDCRRSIQQMDAALAALHAQDEGDSH